MDFTKQPDWSRKLIWPAIVVILLAKLWLSFGLVEQFRPKHRKSRPNG